MSRSSPLVKQIVKETASKMYPDKKLKELTEDERLQVM